MERLKEKVEEIVRATGTVGRMERIKKQGEGERRYGVRKACECKEEDRGKRKVKLRNRKEWIMDDMAEKERRIQWLLRREEKRVSGVPEIMVGR